MSNIQTENQDSVKKLVHIITIIVASILFILFTVFAFKNWGNENSIFFLTASCSLTALTTLIIACFSLWHKFDFQNPYYLLLFQLATTALGFTIATSGQEYLKDKEEKKNLIQVLEVTRDNYAEQIKILGNWDKNNHLWGGQGALSIEGIVDDIGYEIVEEYKSELLLDVINKDPIKIKDLSRPLSVYITNAQPLENYYKNLNELSRVDDIYSRINELCYNYELLELNVEVRKELMDLEIKKLKGLLNEKNYKKKADSLITMANQGTFEIVAHYQNEIEDERKALKEK